MYVIILNSSNGDIEVHEYNTVEELDSIIYSDRLGVCEFDYMAHVSKDTLKKTHKLIKSYLEGNL